jgi:SAM-dependent methyltransferase
VSTRRPDPDAAARFRKAYAALREREGRGYSPDQLLALPYLEEGPWAAQWRVRARTYERFIDEVIVPLERASPGGLRILDLGAGNGWLCHRLQRRGHVAIALDWRSDSVDGLGAARGYAGHVDPLFPRVVSSFDALPFVGGCCDLAVFNASIHYTTDLRATLTETIRVLAAPGGSIAILDSPFYRAEEDGAAMVAEKRRGETLPMGDARSDLLAIPSIEFLTRRRLEEASEGLGVEWQRHRVRYPLPYELRPLWARIRGRRPPSRFDLWMGRMAP